MKKDKRYVALTTLKAFVLQVSLLGCLLVPSNMANASGNDIVTLRQKYENVIDITEYYHGQIESADSGKIITSAIVETQKKMKTKSLTEEAVHSNKDTQTLVVYVPKGDYKLKSAIQTKDDDVYIIAEKGAKIVAKGEVDTMLDLPKGTENVVIDGGIWDGANKANCILNIEDAKNVRVENCSFVNSKNIGISVKGAKSYVVYNNISVSKAYHGFAARYGAKVSIKNSKFYSNKYNGIVATQKGTKVILSNCKMYKNGTKGDSKGHGIGVGEGASLNATSCTIKDNKQCGISIDGKGSNATIKKCTIQKNKRHGIGVSTGAKLTAQSNTITKNGWNGVMIRTKSSATLKSNTITYNKVNGLSVAGKSKATATSNKILSNKGNGFFIVEKSSMTAYKNTISKNSMFGIYTDDSTYKDKGKNKISNNGSGDVG